MSLYNDLGVRKDAKPDEIKRAYRKRARATHPDKPGGDKEMFQKVAKAYALLSDDSRRAQYDKTGEEDSDAVNKLAIIAGMLFNAIDQAQSVDQEHLIEHVRSNIAHGMANGEKFISDLRVKIFKRELAKNRITKKSGNNLLAEMIQGNIDVLNRQIDSTEKQIEEGREMLTLLADYDYQCDFNMLGIHIQFFPMHGGTDGAR